MRLVLVFILTFLFSSCGVKFQYSALNYAGNIDGIYGESNKVVLKVPNKTKIDTITSFSDLRWKLRTDFNFRYDFAQYAMNQPYSWYWNNPRLEGIWRPYNRFDVYFYSNWFWNDWAFNYPFHHTWGWSNWYNWNRPYYYYGWNRPYRPWNSWYQGPFNNSGYNVVYNASRRGALSSNVNRISNNISNRLTVNRNKPRINVKKPISFPTINNNSRPRINNNNNSRPRINNNSRPRINNNYNSRPSINSSRSPNTVRSSNSKPNNTIKQRQ
mgnify:CR=1 FL=1